MGAGSAAGGLGPASCDSTGCNSVCCGCCGGTPICWCCAWITRSAAGGASTARKSTTYVSRKPTNRTEMVHSRTAAVESTGLQDLSNGSFELSEHTVCRIAKMIAQTSSGG